MKVTKKQSSFKGSISIFPLNSAKKRVKNQSNPMKSTVHHAIFGATHSKSFPLNSTKKESKKGKQSSSVQSSVHHGMFGVTQLPVIPILSHECEANIKKLQKKENSIRLPPVKIKPKESKKKRTKLNGFMAYRSYYSRNIPTEHQADLSLILADEWKKDLQAQLVWKRYAIEFNAYSKGIKGLTFTDWLLSATSNDYMPLNYLETQTNKNLEKCRIQNIFEDRSVKDKNFGDSCIDYDYVLLGLEGVSNVIGHC